MNIQRESVVTVPKSKRSVKDADPTQDKFTVFISGFPTKSSVKKIEHFLQYVCQLDDYKIRMGKSYKFCGYCFVCFDTMGEAEEFCQKEKVFEGKLLNSKISIDHQNYIYNNLAEAREPRKVFIDSIPKDMNKKMLNQILQKFGSIELLEYVVKEQKPINITYVTFQSQDSARKCVTAKIIHTSGDLNVYSHFSKPNFTKNMLIKLNPKLRQYLKDVQKRKITYNPVHFAKLHDDIINSGENAYNSKDKKNENPESCYLTKAKKKNNNQKLNLNNSKDIGNTITDASNSTLNSEVNRVNSNYNTMEYNDINYSKNKEVQAYENGFCNPTGPYNSYADEYYGSQPSNTDYYSYNNKFSQNNNLIQYNNDHNSGGNDISYNKSAKHHAYTANQQQNLKTNALTQDPSYYGQDLMYNNTESNENYDYPQMENKD